MSSLVFLLSFLFLGANFTDMFTSLVVSKMLGYGLCWQGITRFYLAPTVPHV